MGLAKEAMIEAQERGSSSLDGLVCMDCLIDEDLLQLAATSIEEGDCTFCGNADCDVVRADLIQERIFSSLREEYANVDEEGLPYCSAEGGYVLGDPESIEEVVQEVVGGCVSDEFLEALCDSCQDEAWCKRDWALMHPYDNFVAGWQSFTETVKERNRLLALEEPESDPGHPDSTSPRKTVELIGRCVEEFGMIKNIDVGTKLFRARQHGPMATYAKQTELASPPHRKGGANRLSAAGISMFYGAEDEPTAIQETCDAREKHVSIGQFAVTAPILVIDFTGFSKVPGFFSGVSREERAARKFISDFLKELSMPIARDGTEHSEYAPTQVVAGYLIHVRKYAHGKVMGIKFKSSKTGKANYAIDLPCDLFETANASACPLQLIAANTRPLQISVS